MSFKKIAPFMAIFVILFMASACGNAQKGLADAKLKEAQAAVAKAKAFDEAQGQPCPDKLASAEDALAQAESQFTAEDYEGSLTSSEDTIVKSDEASDANLCKKAEGAPPLPPTPKKVVSMGSPKADIIYFDTDRYNIRPSQISKAKSNAKLIKEKWAGKKLLLQGHCDERGSEEYNFALGDRRAKTVRKFLTTMGVDAGKVFTKSFGETKPAAYGHSEAAWAKNRRVKFEFK